MKEEKIELKKFKWDINTAVNSVPYILIVLLIILFSALSPAFRTYRNVIEILVLASIFLMLATGETFPVLIGSIDLSVGSMIVGSGIVAATIDPSGGFITVVLMLVLGLIIGIINGSITVFLKLPSFIVTLATSFILSGIGIALTKGYCIGIRSRQFSWIATGNLIDGVPNVILWALIVYFVFVYINERTKFGRYLFAIGGDEDVAARMGINVDKYRIIAFALSGLLTGFATLFLSSKLGVVSGRLGPSYLFNALIAVVVGGTPLSGGIGGVKKTFIGVLIITILENGMNLIGMDIRVQYIIKTVVLIFAVYVNSIPVRSKIDFMK